MNEWKYGKYGKYGYGGRGEKQTDRRLENSNILNKYDNKVGGSKVRVAGQKKTAENNRNYKKVGGTNRRGCHARFPLTPAPPCGIVKIVAGCKNFCMCLCVCVWQRIYGSRKIFIALSQVFMGFLSYKMPRVESQKVVEKS